MTLLHPWEVLAWLGALGAWAGARWLWPRWAEPLRGRVPPPLRRWIGQAEALGRARPWLPDLVLVLGVVLLAGIPLWQAWDVITPNRAPCGPDFEGHIACALAFELGDFSIYYAERYPAYPWLISLLSPSPRAIPQVGTLLSMVVTVASAVGLYWTGRHLAGRAAGFVGAILALRQPLAVDVGHSFNAYPLVSFCYATMAGAFLHLVRTGAPWTALVLGLAGALAAATRVTAIPFVLGVLGLAALYTLFRTRRRWWVRVVMVGVLLAPLPATNLLFTSYRPTLWTLEDTLLTSPLNLTPEPLEAHRATGFHIAQPDAWRTLVPSFIRAFRYVHPPEGHAFDPEFADNLSTVFPRTSPLWVLALLALPVALVVRRPRDLRQWMAQGLLVLLAFSASSTVRNRYEHRYFYNVSMFAPLFAVSGISLVLGPPAAVAAGLAAALLPGSGYGRVDDSYLSERGPRAEPWVMGEDVNLWRTTRWADETLAPDAVIYDFSAINQLPILGTVRPYRRCTPVAPCQDEIVLGRAPAYAVLRVDDVLTAEVPWGPGQKLQRVPAEPGSPPAMCISAADAEALPEPAAFDPERLRPWQRPPPGHDHVQFTDRFPPRVGQCWQFACEARFDAAIYEMVCDPTRLPRSPPPPRR